MFHVRMSLGLLLAIIGIIGCIVPVLPGTLLSLGGMILIEFATEVNFSTTTRIIVGLLTVASVVSDYIFPLLWAKKWWWTKAWSWGSIVGMVWGFFFPPRWLIIWPILWAFGGEYLIKRDVKHARKSARGSFLGSTASTVVKLIAWWMMTRYIIAARI